MTEININDYALIYPTQKGWLAMIDNYSKLYIISIDKAKEKIEANRVGDAYRDQLWSIMCDFGDLFFNGSDYFTSKITLPNAVNLSFIG